MERLGLGGGKDTYAVKTKHFKLICDSNGSYLVYREVCRTHFAFMVSGGGVKDFVLLTEDTELYPYPFRTQMIHVYPFNILASVALRDH